MIETLRRKREQEEGFTLIELMVVVLIIAILLAIAIPTFLGAQDRAKDRGAQSNLRNSLTAAKTIATDSEGTFGGATVSALNDSEGSLNHQATGLTPASDSKDIRVQVFPGDLANTTGDNTPNGEIFLSVRSASGKYFGICADYKGKVQYAQGATTARQMSNCTAQKF